MQEPLLAFVHLSAVLGWVVFASSEAALCRAEWLNAAVVRRLGRLDRILWMTTAAVFASGLVRVYLGAKGAAWYWGNPLLHLKLTLFVAVAVLMGMLMFIRMAVRMIVIMVMVVMMFFSAQVKLKVAG